MPGIEPYGGAPGSSGSGSGLPSNYRLVNSAPASSANGDFFICDATTAGFAVPKPVAPLVGTSIAVKKEDSSTHAVTIAGTIDGDAGGVSIDQQDHGVVIAYSGATDGWQVVATMLPGGGVSRLQDATDVLITGGLTAGQGLFWNTTDLKFENTLPSGGGGSSGGVNWIPNSPSAGKLETMARSAAGTTALTLTSGRLYCMALPDPLKAGVTYSGITFFSAGTALASGNNQWFALIDAVLGTFIRSTTDDTNTAWGANAKKRLALSTPYVPSADQQVYVGAMVNATTPPNLTGRTANGTQIMGLTPIYAGNSTTGMTTPVADGTAITALTALVAAAYAYVD